MTLELAVDRDLKNQLRRYKKCLRLLKMLENDEEVYELLEQANKVSVVRMGFNDHGRVHAKIVALASLKIYDLLEKNKIYGHIVLEKIGNYEDVRVALLLGSYIHDIGISISRKEHEMLGVVLAKGIITQILLKLDRNYSAGKIAKMRSIVLEEILCHLGRYTSSSLESKIVATADGADMTKGRARIPYQIAKPDIHKFSALAIENVSIEAGNIKPVKITANMNDTTGIFQIELQLLQKIHDVGFTDYVEVVAKIKDGREIKY